MTGRAKHGVGAPLSPLQILLAPLLDYLRRRQRIDLTPYRPETVDRRVTRRMRHVAVHSIADYIEYLEGHRGEYGELVASVLINVTSFFRDSDAWDMLAREIIPRVVAGKRDQQPIRVWSAGCASGEEASPLAMLLAEHLGIEKFRERVRIYGTDVDDDALLTARRGTYSAAQLEPVPEDLRSRY